MRITCVIHSLSGGGAERLMAGLASRLAAEHEVTLVTLDRAHEADYPLSEAVSRTCLNLMEHSRGLLQGLLRNRNRMRCLACELSRSSPEVVLSFCDKTNILTLASMRRSELQQIPVVIAEHTDPSRQRIGPVWHTLRRWYYPGAAGVVVLTQGAAEMLRRWVNCSVEVISPAIEVLPLPQPGNRGEGPSFRWLSAGRLSPEKGVDRTLRAFAELAKTHPDAMLSIAGSGPQERELRELATQLGIDAQVEWLGWVHDVSAVMRQCNGFVLTSHYEGFPLGLLEAMASGLTCVAMDVCGVLAEVIVDGENGQLVPAGNIRATAAAMANIMDKPREPDVMFQHAATIRETFSWNAYVAAHDRLLRHVVDSGQTSQSAGGAVMR